MRYGTELSQFLRGFLPTCITDRSKESIFSIRVSGLIYL